MGSLDLTLLQEGFGVLVSQAETTILPAFMLWLDLKLSEYKLNGRMFPDFSNHRDNRWLPYALQMLGQRFVPPVPTTSDQRKACPPSAPSPAVLVKTEPSIDDSYPLDMSHDPSHDRLEADASSSSPPSKVTLKVPSVPYQVDAGAGFVPGGDVLNGITCPECGKQLQYRSSYRRHMRLHQGVYTHMCAVCARKFTRKEHFLRHKCNRRSNLPHRSADGAPAVTERILKVAYPPAAKVAGATDASSDSSLDHTGCTMLGDTREESSIMNGEVATDLTLQRSTDSRDAVIKDEGEMERMVVDVQQSPVKQEVWGSESRRKRTTPRKVIADLSGVCLADMDDDNDNHFYMPRFDDGESMAREETPDVISEVTSNPVNGLQANHTAAVVDTPSKLSLVTGDYAVSTSPADSTQQSSSELNSFIKVVKQGNYLKLKKEAQLIEGRLCFVCPHCGKVFHRSSNFSRHMRIHRGVYSYVCPTCRRGFFRKEHFLKHKCHRRGMSHIWRRKTKLDMLAPCPAAGLCDERDAAQPLAHMPLMHNTQPNPSTTTTTAVHSGVF